jgi:hypothetical protein
MDDHLSCIPYGNAGSMASERVSLLLQHGEVTIKAQLIMVHACLSIMPMGPLSS